MELREGKADTVAWPLVTRAQAASPQTRLPAPPPPDGPATAGRIPRSRRQLQGSSFLKSTND